jgi:glycosyltransferase involved in cell wall biosynthesis
VGGNPLGDDTGPPSPDVAPAFSVIIPVWNEAPWLPRLLRQLSKQPAVAEVIIADNNSRDGSRLVAEREGCRVIEGGSPGEGRNAGANAASQELLVFIDADAALPAGVFERLHWLFREEHVGAIHCPLTPATSSKAVIALYWVMEHYLGALDRLGISQGVGTFLAARSRTFHDVGGFDTKISAGEDADFFRRVQRSGTRVIYDRGMRVGVSARRFKLESTAAFALKTALWALLRLAGSRRSLIPYKWRVYATEVAETDVRLLDALAGSGRIWVSGRRS